MTWNNSFVAPPDDFFHTVVSQADCAEALSFLIISTLGCALCWVDDVDVGLNGAVAIDDDESDDDMELPVGCSGIV